MVPAEIVVGLRLAGVDVIAPSLDRVARRERRRRARGELHAGPSPLLPRCRPGGRDALRGSDPPGAAPTSSGVAELDEDRPRAQVGSQQPEAAQEEIALVGTRSLVYQNTCVTYGYVARTSRMSLAA
jgi:hypothetical protein